MSNAAAASQAPIVVPVFNGQAERFTLRAVRLFRRSLVHRDAGIILAKHLRTRVPAEAVDIVLADLASLFAEIDVTHDLPRSGSPATKSSTKQEFFLISLLEASQREDTARAAEAAIALLDTFGVQDVLRSAHALALRLEGYGLRFMPIGAAAFSYFADYKAVEGNVPLLVPGSLDAMMAPLRLIAS